MASSCCKATAKQLEIAKAQPLTPVNGQATGDRGISSCQLLPYSDIEQLWCRSGPIRRTRIAHFSTLQLLALGY